jgi:hypothetical protein
MVNHKIQISLTKLSGSFRKILTILFYKQLDMIDLAKLVNPKEQPRDKTFLSNFCGNRSVKTISRRSQLK